MAGGIQKNINKRFAQSKKELNEEKGKRKKIKKHKLGVKIVKTKKKRAEQEKPDINELSKQYGLSGEEIQEINERINQSKRMIIITGVSFFMVLVFVFWLINTSYSINKLHLENKDGISDIWNDISQNMQDQLDAIQSETKVIDNLKDKLIAENAGVIAKTSSSSDGINISSTSIDVLMEKINKINNTE
jgi:hypothetical protein